MSYYHEQLEGWSEFVGFYGQMVEQAKEGDCFVEIGIWKGRSTIAMAEFIRESGKRINFVAVDHFLGSEEHQKDMPTLDLYSDFSRHVELSNTGNYITLALGHSVEVAKSLLTETVNFIYLDASHDYDNVKADLNAWYPKLVSGGVFAGHDWGGYWPGVTKAVTEFAEQNSLIIIDQGSTWRINKP